MLPTRNILNSLLLIIGLLFISNITAQAQADCDLDSHIFCTASDSLMSNFWLSCQRQEPLDLTALEAQVQKEGSPRAEITLDMAKELKIVFERENFYQGFTPSLYKVNIQNLDLLAKKAKDLKAHGTFFRTQNYIKFIYEFGYENDKVIERANNAVAYYEALSQAEQKDIRGVEFVLTEFYYALLSSYMNVEDYDKAQQYFEKSLSWGKTAYQISKEPKMAVLGYVRPLVDIGLYYANIGNYDSTHYYFDEGIRECEKVENNMLLMHLYRYKGDVDLHFEKYETSIKYYIKALSITEKEAWNEEQMMLLYSIGDVYRLLENDVEIANYSKKIKAKYEELSEVRVDIRPNVFEWIAIYCKNENQLDSALAYTQKRLEGNQMLGFKAQIFFSQMELYRLYQEMGDSTQADYHATEASYLLLLSPTTSHRKRERICSTIARFTTN